MELQIVVLKSRSTNMDGAVGATLQELKRTARGRCKREMKAAQ